MTLFRKKSYGRMKLYFRTRILTLVGLIAIHALVFVYVLVNTEGLALAYDFTNGQLMMMTLAPLLTWEAVDLYWSIAVKTYKDSKKGKKGEQAAKRLSKAIDPNSFLLDHKTTFNPSMQA